MLNKSCGVDGLSAEHFIYAGDYVKVYLSILFTYFISHGYVPNSFMKSAIIPLMKNKTGDTNDKNNYRPITLETCRRYLNYISQKNLMASSLRQIINLVLKPSIRQMIMCKVSS